MENEHLNWKKIKEENYKSGYRKMVKRTFLLPNGKEADFDLNAGGLVVCILALTKDNRVILTKQYRPAQEKVLIEIPGGGVHEGEEPILAATRELLEETGYKGKMEFVCTSLQSAYDTLIRYNFVATECEQIQEPQPEENSETVEVTYMDIEAFKNHLKSGQLTDVATGYLGLEHLNLI